MPYKINFDKVDNYYNLVMNNIKENSHYYSYEYVSRIINRINDSRIKS
jgi:small nuclear ribonucleoprotein (snRNP)-like protein